MKKSKIIISALLVCILVAALALFTACGGSGSFGRKHGKDQYGREYGNVYDIDGEATGVFEVDYKAGSNSSMGLTMIKSYCHDKVKITVSEEGITMTFFIYDFFTDVKINGVEGEKVEEDEMYGYAVQISREELNETIAMSGYVSMMNKDTAFTIDLDLTSAVLIG